MVHGFAGSKGAALRGPGHRNHPQAMGNQTLFNNRTLDGCESDWSPNCTNGIVMQRKRNQIDQSTDFHAILLAERNLIVSGPDGGLELLTSSEGLAVDDQAPLLHEQFVALRQRGMNRRKLNLIDAALERLDRGDFGVCQECGRGHSAKTAQRHPLGRALRSLPGTIGTGGVFGCARPHAGRIEGRIKAKMHRSILRMRSKNNMRKSNMQPAWKILAPIDLSINAEGPVEHATNIALAMGAELTLLYVVDQRCNSRRGRLRWPSNALNDVLTDCAVHRLILPAGNPAETIARYAEFINADLLAMTSEHYGRWSRFWKHSVTRDVMRCTKRPLCVTDLRSADADYRFRCRRILCMLSLDGTDDQLLLHAQALAQRSASDLILLGVVPEIDEGILLETILGFDRPLSRKCSLSSAFGCSVEGISVPYKTSVMIGSPYNCIRIAAREHSADVVMAARPSPGRTESNCLDMRSVLRRLPCPLISVTESLPSVRSITREREAAPDFEHASSF